MNLLQDKSFQPQAGPRGWLGFIPLCLLVLGLAVGPVQAQETPELTFPITVSTDAGGEQELTLGLDPDATSGIDNGSNGTVDLGEDEQPPVPPSGVFDARLIDSDIDGIDGFGEGLVVDIRQGSSTFDGTKEHEITFQPDDGATEVTISWNLPSGVTGTLTDVILGGGIVNEPMEGSGSFTITNLNVDRLFVTLEYSGATNQPPVAANDGAVTEQETATTIDVLANDSDPDGTLDATSVAVTSDPSNGTTEVNATTGEITYTPEIDFFGIDSFTYSVADDQGDTDEATVFVGVNNADSQSESAVVDVNPGDDVDLEFTETGVTLSLTGVNSNGVIQINFLDPSSTATAPSFVPGETFDNVSPYFWEGAAEGVTFDGADMVLDLGDTDITGLGDPNTVTIIQDPNPDNGDNSDFDALTTTYDDGGTPGDPSDDTLTGSDISTLGVFHLASNSAPLPVELTAFDVALDGQDAAVLTWATASETDNAGFAIQHKAPGTSGFAGAGFVEGAGTTTAPQSYRFRVADLTPGTHSFRLKQVDTDGSTSISDVVSMTVDAPRVLSLQLTGTNPVRSQTSVAFTVPENGPADVALYNVLGQRVQVLYDGPARAGAQQTVDVSTTDLPSGTYFVRLTTNSGSRTQQIAVIR